MDGQIAERLALIALLTSSQPLTPARLRNGYNDTLSMVSLLARHCIDSQAELERASNVMSSRESDGATRLITFLDADYPSQLLDVHNYPPVIFTRGKLPEPGKRDLGIAIVGSRNASSWAIDAARDIARGVSQHGLTIVSGLARGIDTSAHTETLRRGGRTVAVIGTGIRQAYPKENQALQRSIEERGLVISQFWPDEEPRRHHFPMRNVVMSAYSSVTVVVEASEKSGTRHQVTEAVKHGRAVILTRPVAENTSWGKKYGLDPLNRVFISNSIEESVAIANDMVKDRTSRLLEKS